MIKAQSEKTWLKIGRCPYCGKEKVFTVTNQHISKNQLSHMAYKECDCADAIDAREQRLLSAKYFESIGRYDLVNQVLGV